MREALPFAVLDDATLADWFGRFITRYRVARAPAAPDKPVAEAAFAKLLGEGVSLLKHPWSRMAWARGKDGATLFANGYAYPAPVELAERLCAERTMDPGRKPTVAERTLLLALVNDGHLVVQKGRRR